MTKSETLQNPSKPAARHETDFDLWLACWTQEEIAEAVGVPRQTVDRVLPKTEDVQKWAKPAARLCQHDMDVRHEITFENGLCGPTGQRVGVDYGGTEPKERA